MFKVVFILFFQGDELRSRVRKICEAFHATLYQCPETAAERDKMNVAVAQRIEDLQSVLQTSKEHCTSQLKEIAEDLDMWQMKVRISILRNSSFGTKRQKLCAWMKAYLELTGKPPMKEGSIKTSFVYMFYYTKT